MWKHWLYTDWDYVFQGEDIPTPPRIDTKKLNMLETILEAFNEQMGKDMTKTLIEYVNEQTDKLGLLADNVETIEQLSWAMCLDGASNSS